MTTTLIIILLVVVVLIGFITFTHFRMKNTKPVENSKKIVIINSIRLRPRSVRGTLGREKDVIDGSS